MDSLLRKLQLKEYQMLKDIVAFCESNDIQYFLIAGTLLGAVRHKGFIPWDDDIDIGMDLNNYRKFLKLSKNISTDKYFIQNFFTESKIWHPWTQVRMNNTTSMDPRFKNCDIHSGICMDIFLINGISNHSFYEKIQRKLSLSQRKLLKKYYYIDGEVKNNSCKLNTIIPEFIRLFLIKLMDRIINIDISKTRFCYNTFFVDVGKKYKYESRWFLNFEKIEFENGMFDAPKGAKEYLKARYGKWEELPPQSDRIGHGDIIIDLNNNYTIYQGDKLKARKKCN